MTAIHPSTPSPEAYGLAGSHAPSAAGARGLGAVEPIERIEQRANAPRHARAALRLVHGEEPGFESPRAPAIDDRAGERPFRRFKAEAPSSPFMAQLIAQQLRAPSDIRIDVTPHEAHRTYRFASDQGVSYFGILDPVDFAI